LVQLADAMVLQKPELSPVASLDAPPAATSAAGTGRPSGVVTFLLTDVVGSTRLWQQAPEEMVRALERHDDIIRSAVESHGGVVVKARGEGDSTFNVFAKASDAAAAAVEAQGALRAKEWPPSCRPAVRMAIHTGEAIQREDDYVGTTVNRAARMRAIAEGGETLVSALAAAVISDQVPKDARLVAVGRPLLKDLQGRETIHSLQLADADGGFSLPRSLGLVEHNLPQEMTSFVGRTNEIAEIVGMLDRSRLVTLTGAGGAGKSRLAVKTAWTKVERFDDGVWLVELAALDDPLLVAQSVAAVMSVLEQPGRPILETLIAALRDRRVLIILDNCEHLIDSAAKVTKAILRDCSEVKVLATSREPLRIEGELAYRVPSLSLPADNAPAEALASSEAVCLFLARAGAARPGLGIDDPTIAAIGSICRHLDGMPLAIELAAARVSVLSIADIEARLDHRFGLLTTGARTALPRHQTLQALIDWSYDLLSEAEQAVLRRLSAFAGGFTLEAAEAVCGLDDVESSEVIGLVASLVNKSLVQFEEGEEPIRYRLLETIRAYAATKLARSGESKDVGERHLNWAVALGEEAAEEIDGAASSAVLDRLDRENDNLRAAIALAVARRDHERGLRLGAALGRFWDLRGYFIEGRARLRVLLDLEGPASNARAAALEAACRLAFRQDDLGEAQRMGEACLAAGRAIQSARWTCMAYNALGRVARSEGRPKDAESLWRQALDLAESAGLTVLTANPLKNLAFLCLSRGDYEQAQRFCDRAAAVDRASGNERGRAETLDFALESAFQRGDFVTARQACEERLAVWRSFQSAAKIGESINWLGQVAFEMFEDELAEELTKESIAIAEEVGDPLTVVWGLSILAELALSRGDPNAALGALEQAERAAPRESEARARVAMLSGVAAHRLGDLRAAAGRLVEAAATAVSAGHPSVFVESIDGLSHIAQERGDPDAAAALAATVAARRQQTALAIHRTAAAWSHDAIRQPRVRHLSDAEALNLARRLADARL
jgi:predicted ATPase/class 3 adenylate cyclase